MPRSSSRCAIGKTAVESAEWSHSRASWPEARLAYEIEDGVPIQLDERVQSVLEELHGAARGDEARWVARTGTGDAGSNARGGGALVRLGEFYLATSPQEGRLLYLLARLAGARTLVEFGASFGVSTLYLGAAARDNGGRLFTTEVHPNKCAALRETLERAGLSSTVTLLEGDARQTLKGLDTSVDLVFLDGWKSMYLPVLRLIRPKMGARGVVIADNCTHEAARDYLAEVEHSAAYATEIVGDLAISCILK